MIESWGRGFEKIKDECKKKNVPLPVINVQGEGIMIEILPSKKYVELLKRDDKKVTNDTLNDTLNEKEILIIDLIRNNKFITAQLITKETNISIAQVKRMLKSLKENGFIKRVGSDKTGYWEVK